MFNNFEHRYGRTTPNFVGTAPSEATALADLLDVLSRMGPSVEKGRAPDGGDVVIDLTGEQRRLHVGGKGTPSPVGVQHLVDRYRPDDGYHLLVANHLSADARTTLENAGWSYLDRGGRLRLWLDRVRIDTPVEPLVEAPQKSALDTASGRAVALRLLAAYSPLTVRGLAAELEMAPSSAAAALKALRAESFVEQGSTKTVVGRSALVLLLGTIKSGRRTWPADPAATYREARCECHGRWRVSVETDPFPLLRCGYYLAGHEVHWIQALRSADDMDNRCHLPATWDQLATGFASGMGPPRLPVMGPP